jgi:5-methyltetrahydrofolate--homocysteine methyltransferase
VSSAKREVLITAGGPTVLVGERINPSGKKKLADALKNSDFDVICKEAIAQVEAGADILDINVACPGVDEIAVLPKVVKKVMASVDVPLCIDINNPGALKEALKVYKGKPIVNSVTGEENSLNELLPLVKEDGAAVIGLTIDVEGIPKESEGRVAIAHKIIERAASWASPPRTSL